MAELKTGSEVFLAATAAVRRGKHSMGTAALFGLKYDAAPRTMELFRSIGPPTLALITVLVIVFDLAVTMLAALELRSSEPVRMDRGGS